MRAQVRIVATCVVLALPAACANDRDGPRVPEAAGGRPILSAPPVAMAGRWTLSSPGGGACAVTIGGAAGAGEGTVAPEGGCPGNFFTTRKWTFESGALVLRDHTAQARGQLSPLGGRFEGQATGGAPITLSR